MVWVLLPGMDGTGDLFAPFISQLPKTDLPVIVRYPRNKILTQKEYLRLIDDSLPLTENYILVAESFSGSFAIEIAARNPPPKRLRALILSATFAEPPIRGPLRLALLLLAGILLRIPPPSFVLKKLLFAPTSTPAEVDHFRAVLDSVRPDVLASRLRILLQRNVASRLSNIKAPTVILAAKNDRLISENITTRMAAALTGGSLISINAPHLLLQSVPEAAIAAIQEFLVRK